MRRWLKGLLTIGALLVMTLALSSCSESEEAVCGTHEDCAEGQVCKDGVCQTESTAECSPETVAQDCGGGYICQDNECKRVDDIDTGVEDGGTSNDADSNNANNGEDAVGGDVYSDVPADEIPPTVMSVTPADGATDVALDATVEVTFSEPMDLATINFLSIVIKGPDNRKLEYTVDYTDGETTATINFTKPLFPASTYRIEVNRDARDEAGNRLEEVFNASFSTTYEAPAHHVDLAERFAPVIYQDIKDTSGKNPRADIPAKVDFDGDVNAANNEIESRSATDPHAAHVYYHVTESKSHYFLFYILYYPTHFENDAFSEHHFAGAVFVVDKANEDFVMAEGLKLLSSSEIRIGFKPESSSAGEGNGTLNTFPDSGLEDGTHYPMYITGGIHETCNWYDEGSVLRCNHTAEQFVGDDPDTGVVMRAADTAETLDDAEMNADTGLQEMSYKLVPFATMFWQNRGNYAAEGLFKVSFTYSPEGQNRPAAPADESSLVLPRRLNSEDSDSLGITPFAWFASSGASNEGQWLLDPSYILDGIYDLGSEFSTEYCYNLFFDIDRLDDSAHPECATSQN